MGDNWFVCKLNVINGEWILLKCIYLYICILIILLFGFLIFE